MDDFCTTKTLISTHTDQTPSKWVSRWLHLLKPNSLVLDLACGWGRHSRLLASLGHHVLATDQDAQALESLKTVTNITPHLADLENADWPFADQQFDAIVVTHYLWRPLWPQLLRSLKPQGVLIYETFAKGNETVGRPARDDFLLQPGELLQRCAALDIVAYQNGFLGAPDRFIQRIVAVMPGSLSDGPIRYHLTSGRDGS
jgi:SAM-dependent methyltransferase